MIKAIFLAGILWSAESDSLRLETVNGQTFIVHLVGEKETLFGLSKRYGVTVARILEFNPTADGGIEAGQLLKVPYVPKGRTQTAEGTVHKVQPKETLFSISRMYGVSVDDLKAWNNLRDNALSVGQDVLIKKGGAGTITTAATSTTAGKPEQKKMTHMVAQGETLFSISKMYGVTVDQIKTWNSLSSNELKLSQVLYVQQPMFQQSSQTATTTTTTTTVTPATTPPLNTAPVEAATAGSPVKISESVLGTDEVHELGLAELIEGTEGNRKYLALHRTAKAGSILKVRNELNNREVFVRVAGPLPNTGVNDKLVIKISKSAFDRLGGVDQKFRVEVTYYK
ncbi:MAG TPA: LysM peptidoglycan-binding domain-containing protein [Cyclobacteriaceae bacterium]|nr:LysM peptidoglycan-binding domain-containing protein [Cyclobacteriaceae bacterium]